MPHLRAAGLLTLLLALAVSGCGDGSDRPAAAPGSKTSPTGSRPTGSPPTAGPRTAGTAPAAPQPVPPPEGPPPTTPARPSVAPSPPRRPPGPPGREQPAPPPGRPPCRAEDLTVADADTQYAPETVREVFVLRTRGPDCQLLAQPPAVRVLGPRGEVLASARSGGAGLPLPGPAPLTISRGTSLSFFLATPRDGSCTPAVAVLVTLPGTQTALRASTTLRLCGGSAAAGPVQRLGEDD